MSDGTSRPSASTVGGAWFVTMCATGRHGVRPPSTESARERCRTWLIHAPPRFSPPRAYGSTKIYAAGSPSRFTSSKRTDASHTCAPTASGSTCAIATPKSLSTSAKRPFSTASRGRYCRTASSSNWKLAVLSFSACSAMSHWRSSTPAKSHSATCSARAAPSERSRSCSRSARAPSTVAIFDATETSACDARPRRAARSARSARTRSISGPLSCAARSAGGTLLASSDARVM
mmetsp:Transcript_8826/g.27729  ORF Transcript_8826/g.27729 Transcript_8826/m.27729 type:complete len:233 (-) Transcript_8826:904-1602(-)